MNFILDTNVCIAIINADRPDVLARLDRAAASGGTVYLSAIVLFELWYGVWKSSKQEINLARLDSFASGPVKTLAFEAGDAQIAGRIRADLRAIGRPIGDYDLLIAAQAITRGMVLVTHNTREFSRIAGLSIEDWQA